MVFRGNFGMAWLHLCALIAFAQGLVGKFIGIRVFFFLHPLQFSAA